MKNMSTKRSTKVGLVVVDYLSLHIILTNYLSYDQNVNYATSLFINTTKAVS